MPPTFRPLRYPVRSAARGGGRERGCRARRKSRRFGWALVLLVAVWSGLATAAEPYTPQPVNPLAEAWRWRQFPELDGAGTRCIAETPDRHVFAGASEGVLEYDGYHWTSHRQAGSPRGAPVDQIMVADDGSVYAASQRGIYRYDGSRWSHLVDIPEHLPFNFVTLRQLRDGRIIASASRGLVEIAPDGTLTTYSSAAKIAALRPFFPGARWVELPPEALSAAGDFRDVSDILEDRAGNVWLAVTTEEETGKLLRFRWSDVRNGSWTDFTVFEDGPRRRFGAFQRLLEADDGRIWVINSSSDRGILVFDGTDWETIYLNRRFGGDEYLTDIVQSDNGIIWVGTIAKLFAYFPDGSWSVYKAPQYPIPANRVILQRSANGKLWLAGYKSKLLLLDLSFAQWLTYDGLSFQFAIGDGEEWYVAHDKRVVRREGDDWKGFGVTDGLMDTPVRLLRTSRGQVWAAGSHRGKAATARWRNDRWDLQLHPTLSWGIDYRAVFEARDGSLWFGGSVDANVQDGFTSGLVQLTDPLADHLRWTYHRAGENGLSQANVYGIGQSPDGRICIGGSQLLCFDGREWQPAADERLRQYVNCLYSTGDRLLVGSRYYGVFVYDGRDWTNYTTADGLPGNTIISIAVLADSIVLVATENGTCAFDGKSWTRNFLPEQLNLDFEGGTIRHSDEHIWIDRVSRNWKRQALNATQLELDQYDFYSTRYRPSPTPPETTIAFNTERVSANGNGLVSWSGRDYFGETRSESLVYSYRLDGGGWQPFAAVEEYAFTGLSDGPHRLEVRARDLDFNVDPTPAVASFEVLAPIWKQAWFIGLMLLFLMLFGVYEYRVHRKNAKLKAVNVSLQDRNEEIRQHRDQLEGMLVQLENLSRAKVGFFTNISHELRTPLTLILGPIDRLVGEDHALPADRRRQLQMMVQRNARRLLNLIDQLLEMRRIEQSALEIKLSNLCLPDFLAAVTELFADLALRRGIDLRFTSAAEHEIVAVDLDKVEKVLANLLSNAFRHTPDGGSITVSVTAVDASSAGLPSYYDRYFEIRVEDTGSGISQDKIALIFDKYYTSPSAASTEAGTGIGLSYTKDLVYLMQGEIRVESTTGVGSRFTVFLPLVAGHSPDVGDLPTLTTARQESTLLLANFRQEQEVAPPSDRETDPSTPRVLIVEDNPDMLAFLARLLEDRYAVVTATSGRQGLQLAGEQTIDLVISDVMMAEMDGISLCHQLKDNLATSHIPVVLLTARVLDESRASGYSRGADDYITKPFNPDLLLLRVANLLEQRRRLREKFTLDVRLTPEAEVVASPDEEFMNRLIGLLHENVGNSDFNVRAMCGAMHLSHMHFIRKVKQLTGRKPIDLLRSFRMKMARDLLAQDSLTVAEVAYRVGFDLPNSFSRTFKKEYGMTPTQFVQEMRERS
ncbi:hybrid sensor histidine kinase/response regulator transcription factor [Lewinella sp. JB7]|uniref:hybrid sensor histidine kinase/response regulator transcription factor n=1 Tax=Lewinella sp. JB7 TaxID=2962887 RepID=UPI0020C9B8E5|nr:hybrid sensor histidine kinase/response regulator transcription factor [Lewinella sp. JB7]MCP9236128.1 response regulator [Lewinella sp. JB7]